MRPPLTTCATCPLWDEGPAPIAEQRAGLCRRPTDTIQPIRIADVNGRGVLDELLADGAVADEVAEAVRSWVAKNIKRLPTTPRTVMRHVWGITFAVDWCGAHPNFRRLLDRQET
jgi:hypothetical protein